MATTFPALSAKMGSTPYYVTTLTARTLTTTARPARETDAWSSASIEDRMQREADLGRIRTQIVPYLAQHPDRFFGAIIVVVETGTLEYESLTDIVQKLPNAYKSEGQHMGFLTIGKGEHIVLDGQHRWIALRDVITATDFLGTQQNVVGDDEVTVIFIENTDAKKTRRIFNKVNRYAKPTGRADNILTSEDDGYAIVTRRLLDSDLDGPLAPVQQRDEHGELLTDQTGKVIVQEYVQWKSNTLAKGMKHLTTISALYENVKDIAHHSQLLELDRIVSPDEPTLAKLYETVEPWISTLMTELDAYREAIEDMDSVKVSRFANDHHHTLLLRPVGQIALVRGLVKAMALSSSASQPMSLEKAIERVNKIDFSASRDSVFVGSILRPDGRMVARGEAYSLASNLIMYLIANEYMDDDMRANLKQDWNKARGNTGDEDSPFEELPAPQA